MLNFAFHKTEINILNKYFSNILTLHTILIFICQKKN